MNKEKIIKGLEWCIRADKQCVYALVDCPFVDECRKEGRVALKQAALEYIKGNSKPPIMTCLNTCGALYKCPECETPLVGKANYCFHCGQQIDWNEETWRK